MQKIYIFFIALITFNMSNAQGFEESNGRTTFTKVVETAKKKEDIYKAIKLWLNDSPNKTKNFIDVDDPTLGILSFNMISSEYILTKITRAQIEYKITIEIKDGKFRYRASDFTQKLNIMGSIITQSYKDFCDTSRIEKSILENDDLKKIETKERKLKNIDEKIADEKAKLVFQLKAVKDFRESIETFPEFLKQKIENYSDF